jgi:SAM-dependent methyltransferase
MYGALAPLYDRLMAHVGYHRWQDVVEQVIRRFGHSAKPSILEIGAGTGLLAQRLRGSGCRYVASDLSPDMCSQARTRVSQVVCADGRSLPFRSSAYFDLVLFLYDGINYLIEKESWDRLFVEVYSRLSTGGLFLFDITTEFNSINNFSEYVDADDFDDCFYFRHSYYHALQSFQFNDFTIFRRRGETDAHGAAPDVNGGSDSHAPKADCNESELYAKSLEHHKQKVFPVGVVRGFVPDSLFEVLGVWDNFSFKKYTPRSERVHFLLRKKERT